MSGSSAPDRALAALWRPTPMAALELPSIPNELHFVRDHFPAPELDPEAWSLELAGSGQTLVLDLARLRTLPRRTVSVVLECAGHRRVEFEPLPSGVPWACGAVTEARWSGASLEALLKLAGIPHGTLEVVLEGGDSGPVEGFEGTHHFARSLPLTKALDRDVLLAYEMGGEPIPVKRGGPVRAIVPGWYATDSVKWLERVWFSEVEFDGVFQAHDYRLRAPGEPGLGKRMAELPVNALITTPDGERELRAGETLIRGIAWGGTGGIAEVLVRLDDRDWAPAQLSAAESRYGRVHFELRCTLEQGVHELSCRALDGSGNQQPARPTPNVRGYANNAVHRVEVLVA